jgi:hypothetical protein
VPVLVDNQFENEMPDDGNTAEYEQPEEQHSTYPHRQMRTVPVTAMAFLFAFEKHVIS